MGHGRMAAIAVMCACTIFAAAAPAGLCSPTATATAEDESLVAYLPTGKIKVAKRISYRFQCPTTACQVTAVSTLVLKGPNLGPAVDTGMFQAGEVGVAFLTLNKAARHAIAGNIKASKLRTSISATSAAGVTDTDTHTFRFKR